MPALSLAVSSGSRQHGCPIDSLNWHDMLCSAALLSVLCVHAVQLLAAQWGLPRRQTLWQYACSTVMAQALSAMWWQVRTAVLCAELKVGQALL